MVDAVVRGRPIVGRPLPARGRATRVITLALPIALFALALGLRVYRLTAEPLWLDEGYTLLFSRMPLDRLITVGGQHQHPPLYYLLVHAMMAVDNTPMMPRVLSALFGSLTVVALFALGARLFGITAGAVAAGLLAVSPLHVFYSQDGRGYALAGLLVVLAYLALALALQTRRRGAWLAYAVLVALCLYAEYTTALVLLPQALLLWRARAEGQGRAVGLAVLGGVALYTPWIAVLVRDAYHVAADYWIPRPSPAVVAGTFLQFVGLLTPCSDSPCPDRGAVAALLAGREVVVAGALVGLVVIAGLVAVRRHDLPVTTLVLWLLLPFAIILPLGIIRPLYLDRVFVDATFPVYLLVAVGLTRARVVAGAMALGMVVLAVPQLGMIYAGGYNPDWRTLGRDLGAAYRPGQAIFYNPGVLQSLVTAYLPASWRPTRVVPLWSRTYLDVPGWQKRFPSPLRATREQRRALDQRLRDFQLGMVTRGEQQVWLVTYDYTGMNDTRRWFADQGFQPILSQLYGGNTRLELWDRRVASALGPAVVPDDGMRQGWSQTGAVSRRGEVVMTRGRTALRRTLPLQAGRAYSVAAEYRGIPPASKPVVSLRVLDARGHTLAIFPRTMWYDWPVVGVWLSQPFGFVAPPGSARATLTFASTWGRAAWRHVAVYGQP